jgi:ATP-binding cassette subfamily B protein
VAILIQAIFATSAIVQDAGSIGLIFSLAPLTPLLRLEKQIGAIPRVSGSRRADGLPANEIRFEGVRFRYPGLEHDVLDGLDLTIPAGRSIAIVGLNGAGKTTLVKLLARLHDPDSGRITADGIDLSELDPACWRAQIGVIFQDFVHYHLTATAARSNAPPPRPAPRR